MGLFRSVLLQYDDPEKRRFLSIFIGVMLVMSFPLINDQLFIGHDWTYHMLRIQSLREGLQTGQFPVRVNPLFLNGYGYASSLFYPDLFLYIPVFFQLIGIGIEVSYKLFLVLVLGASYLTAYICGRGITKSTYAGIVIAVVFSLSQYHLQNVYTRFALGEVQAYIFLPFIAYGLFNLIYENFDKPWLLVLGFTGLIYSHMLSTVLAALVSMGVILVGFKRIFKDPKKIFKLAIAAIITLGLTCLFWMPMVEQLLANRFEFQHLITTWVHTRAVRIPVMFANSYLLKGRDVSIGLSLTLLCLLWIFIPKTLTGDNRKTIINWSLAIGLILLFMASDLFPWQYAPPQVNSIQFPWRFYALASLFLAIAIGTMAHVLFNQRFKVLSLIMIFLFMSASAFTVITTSIRSTGDAIDLTPQYYQIPQNTNAISGGEWLPAGVEAAAISYKPLVVESNTGETLNYSRIGLKTVIPYPSDYEYVDVPSIYYRGYSVIFKDDEGNSSSVPYSNEGDNKSIRIYTKHVNAPGTITVDYSGTTIQNASIILTLLFFLAAIVYVKWQNRRSKNNPIEYME